MGQSPINEKQCLKVWLYQDLFSIIHYAWVQRLVCLKQVTLVSVVIPQWRQGWYLLIVRRYYNYVKAKLNINPRLTKVKGSLKINLPNTMKSLSSLQQIFRLSCGEHSKYLEGCGRWKIFTILILVWLFRWGFSLGIAIMRKNEPLDAPPQMRFTVVLKCMFSGFLSPPKFASL